MKLSVPASQAAELPASLLWCWRNVNRKKVLLFFPSYRSVEAAPPLALLALAPMAEGRGLDVDIVDSTIEPHYRERIVNQLHDAVCVGISIVTGPMIYEAIEIARAV